MRARKKVTLNTFHSFNDLSLPAPLSNALTEMNFTQPTPVQAAAIPAALEGKDVLGTAKTGTGKTAAFGIPLVARLTANSNIDALILAPTRELAAQIYDVLRQMTRGQKMYGALVVGGESFSRQASELRRGADFIVATPGRLNDHLKRRTVDLSHIGFLVLDEVDRMLDMGFAPQIKQVVRHVPNNRQTLLFSATLPPEIAGLASSFLKDPVRIAIGAPTETATEVKQTTVQTTQQGKNTVLLEELKKREGRVLVFTRTKSRTDRVAQLLDARGHDVVSLHGGRTQGQRKKALENFRTGTHRIMVATDLAGRGIDVNDIRHVINYDVPSTHEDYIHRIGRTGRFGKSGNALTLLVSGDHEGERIVMGKAAPSRVVFRSKSRMRRR